MSTHEECAPAFYVFLTALNCPGRNRNKLCVMARAARFCVKAKIPVVALVASERADLEQRASDLLEDSPFSRPPHRMASATWTLTLFVNV
jgi:hypothetical protein